MSDPTSRPAIAAKRDNMDEYDIIFVGLSLRHLLLNLVWHVDQAKSVEQPIDIRHTSDISQRLGSVHYLSNFTDICDTPVAQNSKQDSCCPLCGRSTVPW